jgi:hypothetical protein
MSVDDLFDVDSVQDEINDSSSNPVRKLRNYAKKLEKQLAELEAWKTQREKDDRKRTLIEAGKALGLSEKHAELFLAVRPDAEPTPEAVRAFAEEYGLVAPKQEESKPEGEGDKKPEPSAGFAPLPSAGVQPGSNLKVWKRDEWKQLYDRDPHEALRIMRENRVEGMADATSAQVGQLS